MKVTDRRRRRLSNWAYRLLIAAAALLLWEYLPQISWLQNRWAIFDPFFVSSPSKVADRVWELVTGNGGTNMWPFLWVTVQAAVLGTLIGTGLGALAGLALSNTPRVADILRPFITLMNATPRVALIPIFVVIAGPTMTATVATSVVIVFFLVFYNAYAGGTTVAQESIDNARLLGASGVDVARRVRAPHVLGWAFASLPNAISFSLVGVVAAEILTGSVGIGRLLLNAISTVDSTLTFSVVTILSIVGVLLVSISDWAQGRVLHWWEGSR